MRSSNGTIIGTCARRQEAPVRGVTVRKVDGAETRARCQRRVNTRVGCLALLASSALLVLSTGCPTMGPGYSRVPVPVMVDGIYTNRATGLVFPEFIGDLKRSGITQYDANCHDVSVTYDSISPASPLRVTIYMYPAARTLRVGSTPDIVESARSRR